ncbi:hypothetical protein J2Z21_006480 [Streptomyces griseochromogenes]|uniref:DUF3592 domain-containing protein n=1 Tax=Streptomyces griseochromogenes TaxID=68214 RepID=A0A1B1B9P3_9ACTN|nr:hypothetical protein [Streptomyces griseochromogenes]ANP55556.1 hypothetical protein AVL59_43465 [Streptomyces griseochromogenes]MBP2053487.1 hypothetical protein [Streptomyces griseochromogenes]
MAEQSEFPSGRKQAAGVVVFGALAVCLLAVTVYGYIAAAAHLGLIGHPQETRTQACFYVPEVRVSYRETAPAHYDCDAYLAHGGGRVRMTFSSYPAQHTEVAEEPWGRWVPVERGVWGRLGRVALPLVPLAFAALFARWALRSASLYRRFRGWRNSSLLPTGSSE